MLAKGQMYSPINCLYSLSKRFIQDLNDPLLVDDLLLALKEQSSCSALGVYRGKIGSPSFQSIALKGIHKKDFEAVLNQLPLLNNGESIHIEDSLHLTSAQKIATEFSAIFHAPLLEKNQLTGGILLLKDDHFDVIDTENINEYIDLLSSIFSKRKQEEKTIKLQEKLGQMVDRLQLKNDVLNEFTYLISHDVRKHVANLKLLSELSETEEKPEDKNELRALMSQCINHLNECVNQLTKDLDQSKKEKIKKTPLNIFKLVTNIISSYRIEAKHINFNVDIPYELSYYAEFTYLNSILENLISNAIRYSKEEGAVIAVNVVEKKNYLELQCIDNGVGIDLTAVGDELFEMFRTFHDHPESKGLGLYLVKKHIVHLKGHIDVESMPGKGTTFTIQLPYS